MSEPSDASGQHFSDRRPRFSDEERRRFAEVEALFERPEGVPYEEFLERLSGEEELWQGVRGRYERNPKRYPVLTALFFNITAKEVETFFRSGGMSVWSSLKLPEKPGLVLRQLRSLLYKDFDFYARHPEAARLLYAAPHPEGKAEITGLPLPSFGIRILRNGPSPTARAPRERRRSGTPWRAR